MNDEDFKRWQGHMNREDLRSAWTVTPLRDYESIQEAARREKRDELVARVFLGAAVVATIVMFCWMWVVAG